MFFFSQAEKISSADFTEKFPQPEKKSPLRGDFPQKRPPKKFRRFAAILTPQKFSPLRGDFYLQKSRLSGEINYKSVFLASCGAVRRPRIFFHLLPSFHIVFLNSKSDLDLQSDQIRDEFRWKIPSGRVKILTRRPPTG